MITYIFRRILASVPILLGIMTITFFLINLAPGKPAAVEQDLNPRVSAEYRAKMLAFYKLDQPLHVRYVDWLRRFARFDFGASFLDGRPVAQKIIERVPVTLTINVLSLIFVFCVAVPLGIQAARKPGSAFDNVTTFLVFILFAAPTFWLALLLMQLFCIHLGWFPISGITSMDFEYLSPLQKAFDLAWHLALPVFVSSLGSFAGISRYMRFSMIEAMAQPYIVAARAKGLPERVVVYKHGLRNALLPIVTVIGLSIPGLLGGSVIFESIFALPGLGRLFYEAVMSRDYPLIMASVALGALLTMAGNIIADISYAYVDPRIRYK